MSFSRIKLSGATICAFLGIMAADMRWPEWVDAALRVSAAVACVATAACAVSVYARLRGVDLKTVDFELRARRRERERIERVPDGYS